MRINTCCRICHSQNLTKVFDFGSQPLANAFLRADQLTRPEARFPLEVYVCEKCNLAQLIHVVDKETLFSDYIYFSSGMPKVSPYWQSYAEGIIGGYLKDKNDLVVEIGSNDGVLLWFFKERGFRVLGVDPAANIAPIAESRGVETKVDFFSERVAGEIERGKGKAKAIIGNNVVAHINDHHDLCRGIKKLLDANGVFVFEAPYLVDMFENLTFDTIYHEHLSFLAVRPLMRLFEQFGLEVFDVKIVPAQGQSIRVFVGHAGAHKISGSVGMCVTKELALGLDRRGSYLELAKKIKNCKEKVVQMLNQFLKEGKKIIAYGAPAKGNTVLNYYNIDFNILDCAMDELPSKQGLYTPGTHLLVVSKAESEERLPDYYFLLAWNYLPVIMEKEQSFLARGGGFVLPTGEVLKTP